MKKILVLLFLACTLLFSLSAVDLCSVGTVASATTDMDLVDVGLYANIVLCDDFDIPLGFFLHGDLGINAERLSEKKSAFFANTSLGFGVAASLDLDLFAVSLGVGPSITLYENVSERLDYMSLGGYGFVDLFIPFDFDTGLCFGVQSCIYPVHLGTETTKRQLRIIPGAYIGLTSSL